MPKKPVFVDVLLPLALPGYFTYSVPASFENIIKAGKRVVVQFGKKKLYTAIVCNVHNNQPKFEIKDILQIIDANPIVNQFQITFWQWISMYYMCTPGEVYKAALPSGLKLESESVILPGENFMNHDELLDDETLVIDLIKEHGSIVIEDVIKITEKRNVYMLIGSLVSKRIIVIEESLTERYIPKFEEYISISPDIENEEHFNSIYEKLSRSPKQADLLLMFAGLSKIFTSDQKSIKKTDFLKQMPGAANALRELQKKNVLKIHEKEVSRLQNFEGENTELAELNIIQIEAIKQIRDYYKDKETVLLHGVTSSGKTEIYIHLINEYIKQGKQVLYLLPEIALTGQIINRLRKVFGNSVGIYHSKFSDSERIETYLNVLQDNQIKNPFKIVLGVRSSIFLPFSNLGLIIIDEEHENTYKQFDPAPRYNARDSALMLAKMHGAKVLLGSATPSIESYFHAHENKFGLVELTQRFQDIKMPNIIVVDTKEAYRKKQMKSHFSPILLDEIKNTIESGKQIILFQNRRGFSPWLECSVCNWIPGCRHCDVKLTYHKYENKLICHYCGFATNVPATCPACNSSGVTMKGFGTERIEDDLSLIFPEYQIGRLDLDTARTRRKIDQIMEDFETGVTQILVGTQMISKGLDFNNVGLVGVLNADNMLNFPDFRANERSFQLMAQVSGRAGRKKEQGKVIIQTSQPEHPVIKYVIENDYISLFNWQVQERQKYNYPPFSRMIEFSIKHKQEDIAQSAAFNFSTLLKKQFGSRLIGPEKPLVSKIQTLYIRHMILKIERNISLNKVRELIYLCTNELKTNPDFKSVIIVSNVDPM
jgi:primosomal protein N' (replication factor Y)